MAIRYTVTDGNALAVQDAANAQRNGVSPNPRNAQIRERGTTHAITFRDGHSEFVSRGVKQASVGPQSVPPGYVRLSSGDITPLAAARAAGLMGEVVEHGDSDHRWGVNSPEPDRAVQRLESKETREPDATGHEPTDAAQLSVATADKSTIEAAASAMDNVSKALGAETVAAAVDDAIVSGELPTELPSGVTHEQVNAIVAGFTAQANAVLRDTGVTIDTLNEMLDGNELREARRAVYLNDDGTLREMGAKAIRRLERLPERPAEFRALTQAFGPEVRVHNKNGEPWVTTPNWNMSWSRAVRTGKIKF